MWQQWINALVGLAIIAVPFLALDAASLTWTLVVAGIAVAGLAVWGAMDVQSSGETRYQT